MTGSLRHSRLFDWLNRYGLAECGGIACALVASVTVRRATGNAIAAAYAGAWGETIGYSAVIIARDAIAAARSAHASGRAFNVRDGRAVATGLLTEFGPAGVLDTFVTRPLAMGLGVRLAGPELGVIAGKLAADVLFYLPVVFMYERRKRRRSGGA